jgi:hypothetical protein
MKKESKDLRVNPLTQIPGGYFLTIRFSDGTFERTVNTKSPYHYVCKVIAEVMLEGRSVESVLTSSDEIVYMKGEFNPKFEKKSGKATF